MTIKKRKGYIEVEVEESVRVDVCDIMHEIIDQDLIDECISRDLHLPTISKEIKDLEGNSLYRYLCDITGNLTIIFLLKCYSIGSPIK